MITINICRLQHFDYVKSEDLEKIGMGKPAIRRLMDAVKRKKKRKGSSIFDKVKSSEEVHRTCYVKSHAAEGHHSTQVKFTSNLTTQPLPYH